MNKIYLFLSIIFISTKIYSQDDARIGVFIGHHFFTPEVNDNTYKVNEVSVEYMDRLTYNFGLIYGLTFLRANVKFNTNLTHVGPNQYKEITQNLVSLYANLRGGKKYFYMYAGPFVDFPIKKVEDEGYVSQGGIGFQIGFGINVHIKNLVFSFEPGLQARRIIVFKKYVDPLYGEDDFPTIDIRGRFGVSYKFF